MEPNIRELLELVSVYTRKLHVLELEAEILGDKVSPTTVSEIKEIQSQLSKVMHRINASRTSNEEPFNWQQKKKTILIVDDESSITAQLQELLEDEEYRVFVAQDGLEALEVLGHNVIDLVLTDLRMPGIDGQQLLSALNKRSIPVRAIVMSAATDIGILAHSTFKLGISDYLYKPFDLEDLLKKIAIALEVEPDMSVISRDPAVAFEVLLSKTTKMLEQNIILQSRIQGLQKELGYRNDQYTSLLREYKNVVAQNETLRETVKSLHAKRRRSKRNRTTSTPNYFRSKNRQRLQQLYEQVEALLHELIERDELISKVQKSPLPPKHYTNLADLYHEQKHYLKEMRLLERYAKQRYSDRSHFTHRVSTIKELPGLEDK